MTQDAASRAAEEQMIQGTLRAEREAEEPVPVVFRVLTRDPQKGEAIALFPLQDEGNGLCSSYMHVGQHGSADYAGMIRESRKATPSEYAPLMRELQGAPYHYNLIVYDRKPRT